MMDVLLCIVQHQQDLPNKVKEEERYVLLIYLEANTNKTIMTKLQCMFTFPNTPVEFRLAPFSMSISSILMCPLAAASANGVTQYSSPAEPLHFY